MITLKKFNYEKALTCYIEDMSVNLIVGLILVVTSFIPILNFSFYENVFGNKRNLYKNIDYKVINKKLVRVKK